MNDVERRDLLDHIAALRESADAAALEMDLQRVLPRELYDRLQEMGAFLLMTPRAIGGFEADPLTQLAVFEALSEISMTMAWCVGIGAGHAALAGAYLEDAAVAEIFDGVTAPIIAGQYAPRNTAVASGDGFELAGRWSFASGSPYATWFMCGMRVEPSSSGPASAAGARARPEIRMGFVPRREVELVDNWYVVGLQGTGSCDYVLPGATIPREFTFDQLRLEPRRGGASYRMPSLGTLFVPFHAGMALGAARRALDEVAGLAAAKRRRADASLAERGAFQQQLARAEAALRSARLLVVDALGELWRTVSAGDRPTLDQRALARLAATHATDTAAQAITTAYRCAGGTSIFATHPLQRLLRDIHTATQHIAVGDEVYEQVAQVLLGIESPYHAFL